MNNGHELEALDRYDRAILMVLQADGRISNKALAERVHLSPPACHARFKRLVEQGYILGFHAQLDRRRLGFDNLCYIELSLAVHQPHEIAALLDTIAAQPEVLECHHLTGEYDYLLKVAVRVTAALQRFISEKLVPTPGIARVHTSLVLKEIKPRGTLPLA